MRCRIALLAGLLLVGSTAPALAGADGPSAEDVKVAAEAFDRGKRAFKERAWVEAAEQFEEADARAPSAVALQLAMRARDKAKQLDRAATLAVLALERHKDQPKLVKEAEAIVARGRKELYELSVSCTPECELIIGTKLVPGAAAAKRTLFLPPGGVTVHASWSGGRTRSAPAQAVKASTGELSFEAPPEESGEPAAAKPEPTRAPSPVEPVSPTPPKAPQPDQGTGGGGLPPVVFWVGSGLTLVATGVTVWSGIDTLNNPGKDKVRTECAGQGTDCPAYQDGLSAQKRTNVLIGVSAGLAVTTGVVGLFLTDWSSGDAKSARVQPWVGIGRGAALGAQGVF